jgi:predicted kinase
MEAIIFTGIQASGKSTFYLRRFYETHIRINLDMLRTRHREQLLIDACIAARQSFVVDNTNVTREQRARYIAPAKAAGFHVVGYYFQANLGDCVARNRAREPSQVVPDKGIAAMYHRLQVPAMDEGFDELYNVQINAEGGFVVSPQG